MSESESKCSELESDDEYILTDTSDSIDLHKIWHNLCIGNSEIFDVAEGMAHFLVTMVTKNKHVMRGICGSSISKEKIVTKPKPSDVTSYFIKCATSTQFI